MESKIKGLLGLAMRAGKLEMGYEAVKSSVRSGKTKLVIIGAGISERSRKDALDMCKYLKTDFIELKSEGLIYDSIGKSGVYVIGIKDSNMAKEIKRRFEIPEVDI